MSGGSGGGTVSTNEPPAYQRPHLERLMKLAGEAYDKVSQAPYTGPRYARPRAEQLAGQESTLALADTLAGISPGREVINLGQDTAGGKYLSFESNPYLKGAIEAVNAPIMRQFNEETVPGLKSAAISGGAYGGRQYYGELADAATDVTDRMGQNAQAIAAQNYSNERQLQMAAPELIGQGIALEQLPAQLYQQVGQERQLAEQDIINERIALFNELQQAPWAGLPEYAQLVGGGGGGYGSSRTVQEGQSGVSKFAKGALGGAGLGASAATSIGGLAAGAGLSAFAPWLAGGAVLGGLMGVI